MPTRKNFPKRVDKRREEAAKRQKSPKNEKIGLKQQVKQGKLNPGVYILPDGKGHTSKIVAWLNNAGLRRYNAAKEK